MLSLQVRDRAKIERLLVARDASRRQLAQAAGYASHAYVNRILNGDVQVVQYDRARRIARFLKADLDELFMLRTSTDTGRSTNRRTA